MTTVTESSPGPQATAEPVLEVRGAVKHFGAVTALAGVDFELRPQQVVGLLGDNGAGKSTLVKAIMGVHPLDDGEILMGGEAVELRTPSDARRHGIEAVFQDLALFDNLDVVTNLYMGHEITRPSGWRRFGLLSRSDMVRDARERLDRLQIYLPGLRENIGLMSGGQRQAVAVARAVAFAERVLVLDEPTAALGVRETRNVKNTIVRLPDELGLSVILISHNMQDVVDLCDFAYVMRQGRVVGTAVPTAESQQDIVSMIVGAEGADQAEREEP